MPLVLLILLWLHLQNALAHEAPSGWSYPQSCCAQIHCHPVPCDELTEEDNGNWRWGRFTFDKMVVKPSKDRQCHVCINNSQGLCAFIQQGV